jgi:hypothetical protein
LTKEKKGGEIDKRKKGGGIEGICCITSWEVGSGE